MAGIRLVHVPYKGALPVMVDLTGGQIPLAFLALASALPQVKSGKLPALAITTPRRLSAMPDVPTIAEGGHPGFALSQWYGAFVPSVTAADVVARLNTEPVKIARSGDVRRSSLRQGAELLGTPPDDLSSIVAGEIKRYAKLVAAANVRLDRALARVTRTAGSGASSVRLRGRAG